MEREVHLTKSPDLLMLVGLPASGKSTLTPLLRERGYEVLSSDALRLSLLGSARSFPCDKAEATALNRQVFSEIRHKAAELLRKGQSVAIDATNLYAKHRSFLLHYIKEIPCRKICVIVITPVEICLQRNTAREGIARVPDEQMDRMLRSFECPYYHEGWDLIFPLAHPTAYTFPFERARGMDQQTAHRTLPLLDHLCAARQYLAHRDAPEYLQRVAYYHDVGKLYTQSFQNAVGEPSAFARYYGHENYSAYLYLTEFCCGKTYDHETCKAILYETALINYHMRPWRVWCHSEAAKQRDIALFGKDFISDLALLHDADLAAH